MLTKNDFSQIRKIVREEILVETDDLRESFQAELKLTRMKIQTDIQNLRDKVKNLEIRISALEKSNQEILKNVREIRKAVENKLDLETPDFLAAQI